MSFPYVELFQRVGALEQDVKDAQRNIYIVAGVLGGVDLVLLIAVIALVVVIVQLKKQVVAAQAQKKIEEEMNAQKFQAYTGEELHRKLLAVSTPAVPLNQTATGAGQTEYAFNAPFVDTRVAPPPPTKLPRY